MLQVFVEGLSEWVVRSPKEVYGLMQASIRMLTYAHVCSRMLTYGSLAQRSLRPHAGTLPRFTGAKVQMLTYADGAAWSACHGIRQRLSSRMCKFVRSGLSIRQHTP